MVHYLQDDSEYSKQGSALRKRREENSVNMGKARIPVCSIERRVVAIANCCLQGQAARGTHKYRKESDNPDAGPGQRSP